jgi:hypothetical protein
MFTDFLSQSHQQGLPELATLKKWSAILEEMCGAVETFQEYRRQADDSLAIAKETTGKIQGLEAMQQRFVAQQPDALDELYPDQVSLRKQAAGPQVSEGEVDKSLREVAKLKEHVGERTGAAVEAAKKLPAVQSRSNS